MRHASLALLAAMLWAAALNAALSLVGDGSLAGSPIIIVGTAAVAVAVEFGVVRARADDDPRSSRTHRPRTARAGASPGDSRRSGRGGRVGRSEAPAPYHFRSAAGSTPGCAVAKKRKHERPAQP